MLRKMLFQGLAAAVLIAGAAGLYAAVAAENGAAPNDVAAAATNDTGYLAPAQARTGNRERHADRDRSAERKRTADESHDRRRANRAEDRHDDRDDDGDDD